MARRDTRPRPGACLNCGSTMVDEFCAACGQRNVDMRIPARELALDAVEDGLSLDSRVGRTVVPFLFRPGFLTVEWTNGRRARFSSPLRLYLLTSFVFFLVTSLAPDDAPAIRLGVGPQGGGVSVGAGLEAPRAPDPEELRQAQAELDAAGIPVDVSAAARGGTPAVTRGTPEQHERLRASGFWGRRLDDRWRELETLPPGEALRRVNAAFREWIPRVMFFLVPAAVLILALLWRRRWMSEHVVLALHLHAIAFTVFTVLLVVRLLGWSGPRAVLGPMLLAGLAAWVTVAMRRVYGDPWRWTIPKAALGALLYLVALGVGLAGVGAMALWFA